MDNRIERNKEFLTDLFAGPFRGHAIIADPEGIAPPESGDIITTSRPMSEWIDWEMRVYEAKVRRSEALDDDAVPYVRAWTGTEIFAAAMGCKTHVYEDNIAPGTRPLVFTAREADRLPEPGLAGAVFDRVFEYIRRLRERVGPDVPVSIPDIQSAFDVAALIWNKQDMFVAIYDDPDAVKRLVAKCHRLLKAFLAEFGRSFGEVNFCHCPYAWAPPRLGCWLSEDEAGAISTTAFDEFCLPLLIDLSTTFGGLFMHCCAAADHQYASFNRIPNLRGLNRVFQSPGPRPAIDAFSGRTVLMMAWFDEPTMLSMLDMALPNTRFLFNMPGQPLEEAKRTYEKLRTQCAR